MAIEAEHHISITSDDDIVPARAEGRALAQQLGFSRIDATLIATAISEIARNILVYAGTGDVVLESRHESDRCGVAVVAHDSGPGICDIDAAMKEGFATGDGLGLGLPGARRLMDEFSIDSAPGQGTTVSMVKWRVRDDLERLRSSRNGRGR
jgi:serine/threonine-protein kinase RsbT